jgi:hypothetical protein
MSKAEDESPVSPDETEKLEEGEVTKAEADTPVKADATVSLPLSMPSTPEPLGKSGERPSPSPDEGE